MYHSKILIVPQLQSQIFYDSMNDMGIRAYAAT